MDRGGEVRDRVTWQQRGGTGLAPVNTAQCEASNMLVLSALPQLICEVDGTSEESRKTAGA